VTTAQPFPSKPVFHFSNFTKQNMDHSTLSEPLQMPVQVALGAWEIQNSRLSKLIDSLPDERMHAEIAPGKNSGVYILGHLIAVHDNMLPVLGLGERLYPHLDEIFLRNPEKSGLSKPALTELKANLAAVNERLAAGFASLSPAQWLERHTAVSPEDFEKEPHRNKLNLLLNRTGHLAYHLGQLVLLK
jgi:hypothetical protein